MASNFDMNTFLSEQSSYLNRNYTAAENGKAAMEARELQRAQEVLQQEESGFLSLTLGEKLKELGIGERVIQQLGNTAVGGVADLFTPISDYLEKYENIFDQNIYNEELQANGKQMFFTKMALSAEAAEGAVGQNFVLDM